MSSFSIKMKWQVLRTRLYLEHLQCRNFVLPALLFVFLVSFLVSAYAIWGSQNIWMSLTVAGGNALHFCELNRVDELIRQPANTWSNLGFVAVGLLVIAVGFADLKQGMARRKSHNFLVRYPIFSILFGLSAIYVGLGSLLYHASLTEFFQKHDQMGMYALVFVILAFSLNRIFPAIKLFGNWRSFHLFNLAGAAVSFLAVFVVWQFLNINTFFPIALGLVLITHLYYEFFVKKSTAFTKYILIALLSFAVGFTIWMLDRSHIVCSPESWFQGHAVWHLLSALSALLIYMYYRTDTAPVSEKLLPQE